MSTQKMIRLALPLAACLTLGACAGTTIEPVTPTVTTATAAEKAAETVAETVTSQPVTSESKTETTTAPPVIKHDIKITIDTNPDKFSDADQQRQLDINVTCEGAAVSEVSLTIKGETAGDKGVTDIIGHAAGSYSRQVTLRSGENTFTVTVTTDDGQTMSASASAYYSGLDPLDFNYTMMPEDYEKLGIRLVPVYGNDTDEPKFYAMVNLIELYFVPDSTYEEQDEFINANGDIFGRVIGEDRANGMKQVLLKTPLTEKDQLTYEEWTVEVSDRALEFAELSPLVHTSVYVNYEEYAPVYETLPETVDT